MEFNASQCRNSQQNNTYFQLPSQQKQDQFKNLMGISFEPDLWECASWKINNGICDDICRTDECLNDGDDCELVGCVNDLCRSVYLLWHTLVGGGVFVANYSTFCYNVMPKMASLFDDEILAHIPDEYELFNDPVICNYFVSIIDLNNDGYMNFREYTAFIWALGDTHQSGYNVAIGANCSSCVDGDLYNIDMNKA